MKNSMLKLLPLCLMAALLSYACAQPKKNTEGTAPAVGQNHTGQVYTGKIVGKSKKAKTISIKIDKGDKTKTVMVKFDAETKGVEHAAKGHAAIIAYVIRNGEPLATVIKPKPAKLPQGVTEIQTAELKALMDDNADFVLIDARPSKRYSSAHMEDAVSLPVPEYTKKSASILPQDKDKLLIFYCGGPT